MRKFKIFKKFIKEVNELKKNNVSSVRIDLKYEDIELLHNPVIDFYKDNIVGSSHKPRCEIKASLSNATFKRGLDMFIGKITRNIKHKTVYIHIVGNNPPERHIEIIKVNSDRYFYLEEIGFIE